MQCTCVVVGFHCNKGVRPTVQSVHPLVHHHRIPSPWSTRPAHWAPLDSSLSNHQALWPFWRFAATVVLTLHAWKPTMKPHYIAHVLTLQSLFFRSRIFLLKSSWLWPSTWYEQQPSDSDKNWNLSSAAKAPSNMLPPMICLMVCSVGQCKPIFTHRVTMICNFAHCLRNMPMLLMCGNGLQWFCDFTSAESICCARRISAHSTATICMFSCCLF